jgi:hypothetical protein
MASIDKAAIGFSIAIVAIGVGFAFVGDSAQNTAMTSPPVRRTSTSNRSV